MKVESRRQKAEGGRRKAEGSKQNSLRVSAYCLLPTAFYFFPRLPVSVSPLGRALLVAALFVSAYVLVRYWRSLDGRSSVIRYPLVASRALTLVLVSCALAGVSVEYQSTTGARVLLRSMSSVEDGTERGTNGAHSQDQARREAFAALQGKGFEIVEVDDESIAQMARTDGSFVAGVMLTDGAMSATDARREVERTNRAAGGAPVFVVANYPSGEEPGVTLESITVPGHAARGVPIAVRCTIHARGMRGRASLVTISDDAKVQASASVAWMSDDERQSVTLSVVPKVAGWLDYMAKVEAANNEVAAHLARPFTIYVDERKLRVLFFESQPTWEAKFIRRALEQSGLFEVDYFAQVSRAATVGVSEEAVVQNDEESSAEKQPTSPIKKKSEARSTPEAKLRAALQSAAKLNAYDCVIVGATENTLLSSAESARLREWVERRGGGLVVLGGNSFNGSIVAPGGKLYPLLPSEIVAQQLAAAGQDVSRGRPLEVEKLGAGMSLTPTEAGASGALAGYLSAGEGGTMKAETLAGQGLRLGGLRPGAIVLAVAGQANASGTSETGAALIAAMRYGGGRTLLFAPADSWRIRTSASGNEDSAGGAFNSLWQGIALWTAAGARPEVEIVLSDESPAEGSVLTAEFRVRDASFAPVKIEKLSARLQPLTEDAGEDSLSVAQPREISFSPDAADSNVWRARFPLPARGRFVLEIEYTAGGKSGNLEKHFAVVAASPREMGAALDTLSRVSRESGGGMLAATDINALGQRLTAISSSTRSVRRTWELRTWWPLAFLVPLLLSAEWLARRWWKVD
ncbi:MAG: hypothetical protein H0U54_09035 [Acidobacteria bacterium]|nr:hypothetical protein [Acidobacteriota bacterium]